jgi:hypothetical protein
LQRFSSETLRTDVHANLNQIRGTFNPVLGVCVVLHMHRGLVSSLGILTVDVVLLLAMLIGLLQHAQKSSAGVWRLLYHQVISKRIFSVLRGCLKFVLVYNLVGVSILRRDTTCGQPVLRLYCLYSTHRIAGLPCSEFEWCVVLSFCFRYARSWACRRRLMR